VSMNLGKKGDVERMTLYAVILLILLALIVAMFFAGSSELIKGLSIKELLK